MQLGRDSLSKVKTSWLRLLPKLKGSLGTVALLLAVATAIFASVQLAETKRSLSIDSLLAIKEGYSEPKMQFYEWTFSNAKHFVTFNGEAETADTAFTKYLTSLYTLEYLRAIEFICIAYLEALLGDDAQQFVASYVKADIEQLLLLFYDAGEGAIVINGHAPVHWIKPGNDNPGGDEMGGFPSTLECVTELKIKLEEKSIF
ncbi:MAG: hypothetical protein OXF79_28845 [Chloroflexi bacterium]|nr:hypothetical protein [Chloroflexota bacterium]